MAIEFKPDFVIDLMRRKALLVRLLVANASDLNTPPPLSNVNYSGSGNFIMDALRRLRPDVYTAVTAEGKATLANQALQGGTVLPQNPLIPPGTLINILRPAPYGQGGAATVRELRGDQ